MSSPEEALKEAGVDIKRLVVVMDGGEMYLGQFVEGNGEQFAMTHVKRILRIQQISPSGGLNIGYVMADFNMSNEALLHVTGKIHYFISDTEESAQKAIYALYAQYLDGQVLRRAADAGLHLGAKMPTQ
jgi:hypothetical protein